jgi:ferredoxin-NADP reductase
MENLRRDSNVSANAQTYTATLLKRRWLSPKTFEIVVSRPPAFTFKAGQRMGISLGEHERDYSMISGPEESALAFCIRNIAGGALTSVLSTADMGTSLLISGPYGYFTYQPSPRPAVFVATGTGIAPFCSMAESGIAGFTLLHGVGLPEDLYYAALFQQAANSYLPCLSAAKKLPAHAFGGNVAEYLAQQLEPKIYDFYLCGRREMIRDVTLLIDERFPGSLVYTELFY